MKNIQKITISVIFIFLIEMAPSSYGFSLLGPVAPWMQETNGVIYPGDIGGPMDIGSGYRWNVPVITYGFDRSFLDYFGSNGVAAVESAIQILNDLPPASGIELTNYPFNSTQINFAAQAQDITDLKSQTLSLLLEQLGLAQPSRDIFVMKQWTSAFSPSLYGLSPNSVLSESLWPDWFIPDFIVMRNFDPQTLVASQYINNILYFAYIYSDAGQNGVFSNPADETGAFNYSVAENASGAVLNFGGFYTGLTYDDVGGLRYLLSAGNVDYETLPPGVHFARFDKSRIVDGAWRPGVEKITFVRQPSEGPFNIFLPYTYRFTDFYLKNNIVMRQQLVRTIDKPDFLFCAADNGQNNTNTYIPMIVRTGTAKWLNNATANGNTNGEGPGTILPPIKIAFHKMGIVVATDDNGSVFVNNQNWGFINNSTNFVFSPVVTKINHDSLVIHLTFVSSAPYHAQLTNQTWNLKIPVGGQATLQISTNLTSWNSLATVTNAGSVIQWIHEGTENPPKFFRAIPH